jgi:hypothetical protein
VIFTIIGVTIYTLFVMFLSEIFYKNLKNFEFPENQEVTVHWSEEDE